MTSPPILLNAYNHDGENGISTNLYGKKTAGKRISKIFLVYKKYESK